MRVGIIPAIGAGLQTMAATGQLERLWAHLEAYAPEISFFSYLPPATEWTYWYDFAKGNSLERRCITHYPWPAKRLALFWPLVNPRAFRSCEVLRGLNLQAAVPCLMARIIHGIPFVVSHGADYEAIAQIHGHDGQARKWRWLRQLAFRFAAAVIVPNPIHAQRLQTRFPQAKIRHIPNWVDTEKFRPRAFGDGNHLLYVGRLVKEKNLPRLARVATRLGALLFCVGDGPEREAIEQAGGHCVGIVPWSVLPAYYRAARAFVLPSLSEGHPKALLEAMASGLPCAVSARVEGVILHILDGILFDPEDEEEMALAIHLVTGPMGRELGRTARAKAETLWAKEKVLPREVALLREIAR